MNYYFTFLKYKLLYEYKLSDLPSEAYKIIFYLVNEYKDKKPNMDELYNEFHALFFVEYGYNFIDHKSVKRELF